MPAFDQCHDQVKRALQKDGWRVTQEQVLVATEYRRGFVDARIVREVNGSRQQIMLVEIKCFPTSSNVNHELYIAVGQYLIYRAILIEAEEDTPLYLSIPESIYTEAFDSAVQRVIRDSEIKLVVVNLEKEEIVQWIV